MPKVAVNDTTWTEVLDGAGFCWSAANMQYSFTGDETETLRIDGGNQINSIAGKILYAKSFSKFGEVISVAE